MRNQSRRAVLLRPLWDCIVSLESSRRDIVGAKIRTRSLLTGFHAPVIC